MSPQCDCNIPAKYGVSNSQKNPGRAYYGCSTRACKFFSWADEVSGDEQPPPKKKWNNVKFTPFNKKRKDPPPTPVQSESSEDVPQPPAKRPNTENNEVFLQLLKAYLSKEDVRGEQLQELIIHLKCLCTFLKPPNSPEEDTTHDAQSD
jgi:hypothetical protein